MAVDEFYFHHQRGLPTWEKLGHPLDTMTVLACFAFLHFAPPSLETLWIYLGLSAFSCLFVTKDEPIHVQVCSGAESWLHAVLFMLHPLVLLSAGLIWYAAAVGGTAEMSQALSPLQGLHPLLFGQLIVLVVFLIYQIGYWNFYAKK